MPLPLAVPIVAAAGIGAGASIYSNSKNIEAQERANKYNSDAIERNNQRSIDFETMRMNQERNWANEDWTRTNAYNSPEQQMQRFKEAGLNPHLIYGQGSAASNASMIRGTSGMSPKLESPRMAPAMVDYSALSNSISSAIGDMYNFKNMQADLANKEAQNKILTSQGEIATMDAALAHQLYNEKGNSLKNKYAMSGVQLNNLKEDAKLKFTINELKEFELNKINPIRLDAAAAQLKALGYANDVNLVESQLAKMNLTKGSNAWANTFVTLLKMLLFRK